MARWPNANFIDTSIYSLETWASGIVDSISGYPDGSYNGFFNWLILLSIISD